MKDITKLKSGDKIVIIKDGEYNFKYTVGQVYKFIKEQDGYIRVSADGLTEELSKTTLLTNDEWDFYEVPEAQPEKTEQTVSSHQWKLDNVVMIASSSEYYKNPGSELNPRDISGTISHIDNDDDHAIQVIWSNGKTNSYRPEDLVFYTPPEKSEQVILSWAEGMTIGDTLVESELNAWSKAPGDNYFNGGWHTLSSGFANDRKIEKIEKKDGVMAFLVSGTADVWIRAEGFRDFIIKNAISPSSSPTVPIPTTTPIAKFPYVKGDWIEFDNSIIRIDSLSEYHVTGNPWILSGELMRVSGTWDLKDPMLKNAKRVDVSDERIQRVLPGNSIYKKIYYPTPPPVAPPSRFVVGQIVIAIRDTPWWKKGNIGRINKIRDWNVFTVSIYKDGKFDGSNWTAVNDQFAEYNGNIHILPGTAPEAFTVYTSENWSTPVDKSAVKIVELEFQSPVLLKKKTKKSKLIIINN